MGDSKIFKFIKEQEAKSLLSKLARVKVPIANILF